MSWFPQKTNTTAAMRHSMLVKLVGVLSLLYPAIAVSAIQLAGPYPALAIVGCLLALRLLVPATAMPADLIVVTIAAMAGVLIVGIGDPELGVRLYPVFMSAAMLWAFSRSLYHPPTMIERFARILEPDLDEFGVQYTRKVTIVWIGFFAINGCIALWTAILGNWAVWAIYNGAISYLLAGLLFMIEYLVRRRMRRRHAMV
ncbi:MAG: hypothetical protein AAFY56_10575 [Pseudomonadota bacterium]